MELIQLPTGEWAVRSWAGGIICAPIFMKEKCTLIEISELVKYAGVEEAVYFLGERGCEQWALWLIEHMHLFEKSAA